MKLKQVVIGMTDLTLTKERKKIKYGELFEIANESRANEILKARYKDKPVAIIYIIDQENTLLQDNSEDNQKSNNKKDNDNLNNKNNGTDEEKDNENLKSKNSQEGNGTQK